MSRVTNLWLPKGTGGGGGGPAVWLGNLRNILWSFMWENNLKKNGCVYMYNWISRNYHNIVHQLLFPLPPVFLGLHLQHLGPPGVGVKLELQLLAYTRATATVDPSHICDVHYSSQQQWILNPLSEARGRTCNLWFLVGFIPTVPWQELQKR